MKLLVLAVCIALAGCKFNSHKNAPWDPAHPGELLQQLPNWDREANLICAGHLDPRDRLPHQSGRC